MSSPFDPSTDRYGHPIPIPRPRTTDFINRAKAPAVPRSNYSPSSFYHLDDSNFAPPPPTAAETGRNSKTRAVSGLKKFAAEVKIAQGVETLLKAELQQRARRRRSQSQSREGHQGGAGMGMAGLLAEAEGMLGSHPSGSGRAGPGPGGREGRADERHNIERDLMVAGGLAAVGGVVASGIVMLKRREEKERAAEGERRRSQPVGRSRDLPSKSSMSVREEVEGVVGMLVEAGSGGSRSVPRELGQLQGQGRPKVFMSELTKSEHFVIQHAAAALLLRDPHIMGVVGSFEAMVVLIEKDRTPAGGYTEELFGVSLTHLVKYEGTESHHGVGPGTVKIPTFVDHCISALKEMDMTVEGVFRKSGNLHKVAQVIEALNHSGSDGYTVDLSQLDPTTLATVFKRFLGDLPDPVLTGRLFGLFVATSHIKNITARKRAMHLVCCMMPKVNRDVMEVIFLFLDWVSTFAHINFKIGNKMDLTNIARVMAPTLLRPDKRDPHPAELEHMIAAVLNLLEDQHILHEIPFELAHVLHMPPPPTKDSTTILRRFAKML